MDWVILYNTFILLFLPIIIMAYVYGKHKHSVFKNTGIKYIKPPFPFFGNDVMAMMGQIHMIDYIKNLYNAFPDQRYVGIFNGMKPAILIRDPELIKSITIKEFDTFHDHNMFINEDDAGFGKVLFTLKGRKWRDMRATLSPAFSSAKMKNMFGLVEQCAKNMSNYFLETLKKEDKEVIEIETRKTFSKCTVDAIASAGFGIEINTLEDDSNEFYRAALLMSNFNLMRIIRIFILITFPKILKVFKMSVANMTVVKFFNDLTLKSMKNREEKNIVRPDMIHLLMEAKKGKLAHDQILEDVADTGFATVEESQVGKQTVRRKWGDEYLTPQAMLFFVGGYDATSAFLSFFLYEMVCHPDIQKKVQNEVDKVRNEYGDKLLYENLSKLKYVDMCVCELLRLWTFASVIDRLCTKNYILDSPSKNSDVTYEIKAGQLVVIPIGGLHHDPKYFPDPEKFDPERFSDENKSNIISGTYLPFGSGPRNCIGSRYTLMVVKALIYHVFANFDVVTTKKTEIPLILQNVPITLKAKNGVWVGIKKRQHQ